MGKLLNFSFNGSVISVETANVLFGLISICQAEF